MVQPSTERSRRRRRRRKQLRKTPPLVINIGIALLIVIVVQIPVWFWSVSVIDVSLVRDSSTRSVRTKIETHMAKGHWNFTRGQLKVEDKCQAEFNLFPFPENDCLVNEGSHRPHCEFTNLQVNTNRISSRARGGVPLLTVLGQSSDAEYLQYENGAFISSNPVPTVNMDGDHAKELYYIADILKSMKHGRVSSTDCTSIWKGTTLFITRYDYANLYHSMTDWWNIYFSLPTRSNHSNELELPINLVLLDSHPQSSLDKVWSDLVGGQVVFAQDLPPGLACFERARMVPAGYTSPIFPGRSECPDPQQTSEFVNYVLSRYKLQDVHRIPGRVVVIERVSYLAHARSDMNKTQRLVTNLKERAVSLEEHFRGETPQVSVEVVTLVNQTFAEQIRSIRQADVLIGNHGAGMTHMLFLEEGATVLELSCDNPNMSGFFATISKWKNRLRYFCMPMAHEEISSEYWNSKVVPIVSRALLARRHNNVYLGQVKLPRPSH